MRRGTTGTSAMTGSTTATQIDQRRKGKPLANELGKAISDTHLTGDTNVRELIKKHIGSGRVGVDTFNPQDLYEHVLSVQTSTGVDYDEPFLQRLQTNAERYQHLLTHHIYNDKGALSYVSPYSSPGKRSISTGSYSRGLVTAPTPDPDLSAKRKARGAPDIKGFASPSVASVVTASTGHERDLDSYYAEVLQTKQAFRGDLLNMMYNKPQLLSEVIQEHSMEYQARTANVEQNLRLASSRYRDNFRDRKSAESLSELADFVRDGLLPGDEAIKYITERGRPINTAAVQNVDLPANIQDILTNDLWNEMHETSINRASGRLRMKGSAQLLQEQKENQDFLANNPIQAGMAAGEARTLRGRRLAAERAQGLAGRRAARARIEEKNDEEVGLAEQRLLTGEEDVFAAQKRAGETKEIYEKFKAMVDAKGAAATPADKKDLETRRLEMEAEEKKAGDIVAEIGAADTTVGASNKPSANPLGQDFQPRSLILNRFRGAADTHGYEFDEKTASNLNHKIKAISKKDLSRLSKKQKVKLMDSLVNMYRPQDSAGVATDHAALAELAAKLGFKGKIDGADPKTFINSIKSGINTKRAKYLRFDREHRARAPHGHINPLRHHYAIQRVAAKMQQKKGSVKFRREYEDKIVYEASSEAELKQIKSLEDLYEEEPTTGRLRKVAPSARQMFHKYVQMKKKSIGGSFAHSTAYVDWMNNSMKYKNQHIGGGFGYYMGRIPKYKHHGKPHHPTHMAVGGAFSDVWEKTWKDTNKFVASTEKSVVHGLHNDANQIAKQGNKLVHRAGQDLTNEKKDWSKLGSDVKHAVVHPSVKNLTNAGVSAVGAVRGINDNLLDVSSATVDFAQHAPGFREANFAAQFVPGVGQAIFFGETGIQGVNALNQGDYAEAAKQAAVAGIAMGVGRVMNSAPVKGAVAKGLSSVKGLMGRDVTDAMATKGADTATNLAKSAFGGGFGKLAKPSSLAAAKAQAKEYRGGGFGSVLNDVKKEAAKIPAGPLPPMKGGSLLSATTKGLKAIESMTSHRGGSLGSGGTLPSGGSLGSGGGLMYPARGWVKHRGGSAVGGSFSGYAGPAFEAGTEWGMANGIDIGVSRGMANAGKLAAAAGAVGLGVGAAAVKWGDKAVGAVKHALGGSLASGGALDSVGPVAQSSIHVEDIGGNLVAGGTLRGTGNLNARAVGPVTNDKDDWLYPMHKKKVLTELDRLAHRDEINVQLPYNEWHRTKMDDMPVGPHQYTSTNNTSKPHYWPKEAPHHEIGGSFNSVFRKQHTRMPHVPHMNAANHEIHHRINLGDNYKARADKIMLGQSQGAADWKNLHGILQASKHAAKGGGFGSALQGVAHSAGRKWKTIPQSSKDGAAVAGAATGVLGAAAAVGKAANMIGEVKAQKQVLSNVNDQWGKRESLWPSSSGVKEAGIENGTLMQQMNAVKNDVRYQQAFNDMSETQLRQFNNEMRQAIQMRSVYKGSGMDLEPFEATATRMVNKIKAGGSGSGVLKNVAKNAQASNITEVGAKTGVKAAKAEAFNPYEIYGDDGLPYDPDYEIYDIGDDARAAGEMAGKDAGEVVAGATESAAKSGGKSIWSEIGGFASEVAEGVFEGAGFAKALKHKTNPMQHGRGGSFLDGLRDSAVSLTMGGPVAAMAYQPAKGITDFAQSAAHGFKGGSLGSGGTLAGGSLGSGGALAASKHAQAYIDTAAANDHYGKRRKQQREVRYKRKHDLRPPPQLDYHKDYGLPLGDNERRRLQKISNAGAAGIHELGSRMHEPHAQMFAHRMSKGGSLGSGGGFVPDQHVPPERQYGKPVMPPRDNIEAQRMQQMKHLERPLHPRTGIHNPDLSHKDVARIHMGEYNPNLHPRGTLGRPQGIRMRPHHGFGANKYSAGEIR